MPPEYSNRLMRIVAYFQGFYYATTGIWPLLHINSFEAVTGPKAEDWLVQTVGSLILVSGLVFLLAAWRNQFTAETILLAIGNALCLTLVDVIFVLSGTISSIYLADAALQVVIIVGWLSGLLLIRR
jgi:hypothetical protein